MNPSESRALSVSFAFNNLNNRHSRKDPVWCKKIPPSITDDHSLCGVQDPVFNTIADNAPHTGASAEKPGIIFKEIAGDIQQGPTGSKEANIILDVALKKREKTYEAQSKYNGHEDRTTAIGLDSIIPIQIKSIQDALEANKVEMMRRDKEDLSDTEIVTKMSLQVNNVRPVLIHCYQDDSHTRTSPDSTLRISSVNIMKHNIFRHHALLKHCEDYAPHVVMLVEVGKNDRHIRGYSKINSPIDRTGGVAIFVHQDLITVKTDAMQDICMALVRTDKHSMLALIAIYINPARNDKETVIIRLMTYTDFLKDAYKGLKIIIFGDLNMKKFCLRRGTRKYTHDWTFHRTSIYSTTD